ncbi:integrin beta-1-binding protein 1-like isoform X2 [Gigantopelta aegis]|uniref:integrin beta-1-binding protein 1-like isoform X2 n=1 Tax=Gigantopelta aegis TaxID=1735272 RepID=UPI001B88B74B|nr:integrin beta-1-binding protein 1-like isoform X2 [Gigantopelta aegis]
MFKKNKSRNQPSGSKESVDNLVYYLGMVQDINMGNSAKRDTEAQLIDRVEEAQIEGKLPFAAGEDDRVMINVSRHGIKVLDTGGQEVYQRHPLHTIAQLIHYNDGFSKQNIVVKIGQVGKTVYQCYIFQCHSEDQAQNICQCVRRIFDAITAKT